MKILVCIKQVPATNEVEMDEKTGVLKRDQASAKINPYDLYALELAFTLREEHGGEITAITMGPPQAKSALQEALQMGADRGVLICDRRFAGADVVATSRTLAEGIRKNGLFDLILCGKQTTDGDTGQVGPELAEFLDISHASYVQSVSADSSGVIVEVNLGETFVIQKMSYPCLLTVEKDINTPRLPSWRRTLAIRDDAIAVYSLDDFKNQNEKLYGLSGSPTQVERIFPPEKNTKREMIRGSAEETAGKMFSILSEGKNLPNCE